MLVTAPVAAGSPAPSSASPAGPALSRPALPGTGGATAAPSVIAFSVPEPVPTPDSFEAVVALFEERREGLIAYHLKRHARLARFAAGVIELALSREALPDLATKSAKLLSLWTLTRWTVTVTNDAPTSAATLQEQREQAKRAELEQYFEHPVVKAVLTAFPEAVAELS